MRAGLDRLPGIERHGYRYNLSFERSALNGYESFLQREVAGRIRRVMSQTHEAEQETAVGVYIV